MLHSSTSASCQSQGTRGHTIPKDSCARIAPTQARRAALNAAKSGRSCNCAGTAVTLSDYAIQPDFSPGPGILAAPWPFPTAWLPPRHSALPALTNSPGSVSLIACRPARGRRPRGAAAPGPPASEHEAPTCPEDLPDTSSKRARLRCHCRCLRKTQFGPTAFKEICLQSACLPQAAAAAAKAGLSAA